MKDRYAAERFVGMCPTCGQHYYRERVRALEEELETEQRVSSTEIEHLNNMLHILRVVVLMVVATALFLRMLHV